MCKSDDSPTGGAYFNPKYKCCTYHPDLPNYVVGGILDDDRSEASEGRRRVRRIISKGVNVLPTGIAKPNDYRLLYYSSDRAFGKASSLLCPLYERKTGQCTIWRYREAVCSTWFCKYENGQDGKLFWKAIKEYLIHLQRVLINHSLTELGWPATALFPTGPSNGVTNSHVRRPTDLTEFDLDQRPLDDSINNELWREWSNRKEELYIETYRIVSSLDRESVRKLGGLALELLEKRVLVKREALLASRLPELLVRNPTMQVYLQTNDRYMIISYDENDPITISKAVYELLHYFDGASSIQKTMASITSDTGHTLSEGLVRQLYQRRVLVDKK